MKLGLILQMNLFITIYTKSLILLLLHFLTTLLLNVSQLLSHVQVPHVELLHHALVHLRHLPQVDCARGLKIVSCWCEKLKKYFITFLCLLAGAVSWVWGIFWATSDMSTPLPLLSLSQILAGTTLNSYLASHSHKVNRNIALIMDIVNRWIKKEQIWVETRKFCWVLELWQCWLVVLWVEWFIWLWFS